jgi:Mg-chelatase subunit ChlD
MTTKIAFVVDTSGSMNNSGRVQMGITFARDLLGRPGDELLVQMFAFKSGFTRWPGVAPDPREVRLGPPPPHGWTEFPSRIAQENAQQWLTGQGANGGTNPVGAMTAALQLDQRDLTVVLITDGEFGSNVPAFLTTIEASQIAREKRGLGRATIFVIGTGPSAENEAHLGTVGRRYGGGLHIIRPRRATPGPTATQRK